MKKITFTLLVLFFSLPWIHSQYSYVVIDSMKTGGSFIDNNFRASPLPEGYDVPFRGFKIVDRTGPVDEITFPAACHTDTLLENAGLTNFFATFDYVFPSMLERTDEDTIFIEFDLNFGLLSGSGESGRMNFTLLSNLPQDGITEEDFGMPAYHFWMFSGSYGPCLSYGGSFGEGDNPNPGWNGGAGGYYYNENFGTPDVAEASYSSTDNYPLVPYSKRQDGNFVSSDSWMHYTLVLAPEMMHLFVRETGAPEEQNEEIVFMAIPEDESDITYINEVHGTLASAMPPAYEYFEYLNGFRVFHRGASRSDGDNNFFFTNLTIYKTGVPAGSYAEFQRANLRIKEDVENADILVVATNVPDDEELSVKIEAVSGDVSHIYNWSDTTLVFTEDGLQPFTVKVLNTTKTENDTIEFLITEMSGGIYPAPGPRSTFQLVIRPAEGETTDIEYIGNKLNIYPNPADDFIRFATPLQNAEVNLYSINGRKVIQMKNYSQDRIDIRSLQPGIYFVEIKTFEQNSHRTKFIKK